MTDPFPNSVKFLFLLPWKEVEDTTPGRCATSFKVLVVSPRFRGKPLLQRHRLVNEVLAEELKHIHAFEQRTLTPEQWAKEQEGK
ncbi:PREDICTED: bolA-like protein 2 [Gekko japonicus]|uniref:BolA-like protein 2 n=1 Tax=Gekko japonicus TaxID=146911 RepID=A0ABM1L1P9_GEKJA|nr:PREDICTED: bolA-like protein 2 [Gekko japonicus]